jgi:hypothetical protein
MVRVEIGTVCGAGVVITFYNETLQQTHCWIVADPAEADGHVAALNAMPHIKDVVVHHAVVKMSATQVNRARDAAQDERTDVMGTRGVM